MFLHDFFSIFIVIMTYCMYKKEDIVLKEYEIQVTFQYNFGDTFT